MILGKTASSGIGQKFLSIYANKSSQFSMHFFKKSEILILAPDFCFFASNPHFPFPLPRWLYPSPLVKNL
jgi:hypothetical protein